MRDKVVKFKEDVVAGVCVLMFIVFVMAVMLGTTIVAGLISQDKR